MKKLLAFLLPCSALAGAPTTPINNANVQLNGVSQSGVLAANATGAANVTAAQFSAALDLLGSAARGDILYRGASGWVFLLPGTAGFTLTTNGAGADPSWTAEGHTGTVTSFSAGALSPLFTTSVATPTTTPALSFTLSNAAANLIFAGPTTGSAAPPTYRSLVTADLPAGTGTVTSVGLSLPAIFTVSNSPVTSSGTLTAVLATENANKVWAGPTTGADAAPTFRALVAADIPALPYSPSALTNTHIFVGNASNVATDVAMSGDTSILNTGAVTVAKVNGVSYGMSPSTNTVPVVTGTNAVTYEAVPNAALANSSITIGGASTALGGTVTATTILDSIGSTRGSILYRGASAWSALTPGTLNYVLTSGGAGADPSYQALSGLAVASIAGTANQITASASTGAVTLSLAGPHAFSSITADNIVTGNGASALQASGATITSSGNVLTFAGGSTWTDSSGAISIAASGTNKSVAVSPSGTGNFNVTFPSTGGMGLGVVTDGTGGRLNVVTRGATTTPVFANFASTNNDGVAVFGEGSGGITVAVANAGQFVRPVINFRRARGTLASPALVVNQDTLWSFVGSGWDGVGNFGGGGIQTYVDGTATTNKVPAAVQLLTTDTATGSRTQAAQLRQNGSWEIGVTDVATAAWGVSGVGLNSKARTVTDTSSSGTVATAVANSFAVPTFAASSATTFTDFANAYFAGAPSRGTNVTGGNPWVAWFANGGGGGKVRMDGSLYFGGITGTVLAGSTTTTTLTGGAGNMTITAGTGNSRTLTLRTTTSGGTATNAVVFSATQAATFTSTIATAAGVTWGFGALTTATVSLDTTRYLAVTVGGSAYKILIAP